MSDGGTPFLVRDVAPPALSDWPVVSELKNCHKCLMKNKHVGMTPLFVNHSGELKGNFLLCVWRYVMKYLCA
jgi:hypothetical protein